MPGAGIVDAINYSNINILNSPSVPPVPGPTVTINSVEGFQLVNATVGTFTFPLASLFPAGTTLPPGAPASDFSATIAWGDGTTTAGTITQDASNPSVYEITGTHTYATAGSYPISLTIITQSGPVTGTLVNGAPVTVPITPGATATSTATATVTQGPLAVSALPIVGTEGIADRGRPDRHLH